jgi:hypothetical protein
VFIVSKHSISEIHNIIDAGNFQNQRARKVWDDAVYRSALNLKSKIEKGEDIPEGVKEQIDRGIQLKEEEKAIRKDRIAASKNKLR